MTPTLPPGSRAPGVWQAATWVARPVPWLTRLQRAHGDVFTVKLPADVPWVILADPAAIRELFTGSPDTLRAGEGNQLVEPVLGSRSLLLLDGAEHLRERRMLLPPFHGDRVRAWRATMEEVARAEVRGWPAGVQRPVADRMRALTLEIILRTVFGVSEGARLASLRAALEGMLDALASPLTFFTLGMLGPDRAAAAPRIRRVLDAVDREVRGAIRARRAEADGDDVLSLLLAARDAESGEPMSEDALRDELVTLLVAGHETTATALAWAVERLSRHPAQLAALREEVAGGGTAYADAVCVETLRLRPVLPIVARKLMEPTTIGGHELPAGVKAVPAIPLVHRDARIYPEPLAFRPERWLDARPGTYTWIPFGGGPRRCLGASFALLEMQVVLRALVEDATLVPPSSRSERTSRRAITLTPADGGTVARVPA